MPRVVYTDRQKAACLAELTANNGNLKRTARNTGINVTTVRKWAREWEIHGVPEEVQREVLPVIGDFLEDAIRLRGKLLIFIEDQVDQGKITSGQATTALNVLSDKIRAYEQTKTVQQVEHTLSLPDPEELKELLSGMLSGVVEAAKTRAVEIEAIQEPAAIPVSTSYRELLKEEDE